MERINYLIVFAFLLLLLPLSSGEKVDTDLALISQCTNSTYSNLTYARYISDSVYLVSSEKVMTKNGIYYNYTIPAVNNTKVGTIEYGYRCDVNGEEVSAGNQVFVSLMGEELETGQGILYIVMVIGLMLLLSITIYGAFAVPWKNNRNENEEVISINDLKYLKVVAWIFAYLELLFIISILKNLSGYLLIEGTYAFFNTAYFFLLIAMLPFFPLLIFFTIIIWLSDKKTQRAIERGIPVR